MAARKPAKKAAKTAAKKAVAKKPAKKPANKVAPKKAPALAKKLAQPRPVSKSPRPRRPEGAPRVEKTRVVIPMDHYEAHKDEIKAPIKEAELKWNFLGEGKGLYKRADSGVHCFTQFKDDGVHYSVWGADKKAVTKLLGAWETLLGPERWTKATTSGEQATAAEAQEKESEAMSLWKLAEPQRRPGEPDLFYNKRRAEWEAKKPV